ncbi:MAG: CotH kinase family protein [Cyclobacteriaceae bacterium]|nr:CotH kinase family protein [Cyclobacteriaceae bacterium]
MVKTLIFFFIASSISFGAISQQIVINEVQSSNVSTVFDHTGNSPDWLEIYNRGTTEINLNNYGLSDKRALPQKWTFPSVSLKPGEYLLVFASGLDLKRPPLHWETVIDKGAYWKYLVPAAQISGTWTTTAFDDSGWQEGRSGFGYGDEDDSTSINPTISVFLRKKFSITNPENVQQAWLHMDYDDGFIAYLNGVEIARANVENTSTMPPVNQLAIGNHEALMYQGLPPEAFLLDSAYQYLQSGENVLCIRVFNQSAGSSDLTAIPFFSLGYQEDPGMPLHQSPYFDIPQLGLHTNFKIDSDNDSLYLANASGVIIDSVQVVIPLNYSYGRRLDNNFVWAFFTEPTPSKANTSTAFEKTTVGEVKFSIPGGYQMNYVLLTLTADNPGDSIFYTLDGSEPGAASQFYTAPIVINKNTVVRARVLKTGYLPGSIANQTYTFGVKHDLPIISIITSPDNLWNVDYGIYATGKNASADFPYFGANFWQDWERPASLALYEPDGTMAFQVDGGLKIYGAYSRGNAQKSFAFHLRKAYGDDKVKYKIFSELAIDEFESLVLRSSGNDFNNTMMRDALCNTIVRDLELDQMAYRPAAAYLNGEYWGILNIREKINESFLASHHGVDRENLDILEGNGSAIAGTGDHYASMMNFVAGNNLAVKENYFFVKKQMDIDNYIKYQVAQIFIDNRDWPGNNIKFWRERTDAGKWRWILFDLDFGFNTWDTDNQNFNTLAFALEPNGPGWPNPPWSTFLFRKLMENQSFKNDFINCFADNLNTIFQPQVVLQTIDKLKAAIDAEMPRHMARWYGNMNYRNERLEAMREFARSRQSIIRQHIRTQFYLSGFYNLNIVVSGQGSVRVNTIQPDFIPMVRGIF